MSHCFDAPTDTFQTPSQLLASLSQPSSAQVCEVDLPPPAQPAQEQKDVRRNETLRQARRRFVAESIGFEPTDPDTLSCHDKKRGYLECLEEYVIWLRERCLLANVNPGKIERVSKHTGVSNRSLRTMIVHMENILREDHKETLREETEVSFVHMSSSMWSP
ncbi:hypothetical protein K488DRAFT_53769 [Vararia minispora EC-137]|uniref:Uncharacterized protein n=1 Tax=Vararia minispora EC-137 TaxID=1314806 RepID=A0ACB8QG55_9AGAM|nr:hypothetical protein K488DRAFT_53769 [Vararia minispora EC-137]